MQVVILKNETEWWTACFNVKCRVFEEINAAGKKQTAAIDEFFLLSAAGNREPQELMNFFLFAAGGWKTAAIDVIWCGLLENRSICWIYFFLLFFLFIAAYIKNSSKYIFFH